MALWASGKSIRAVEKEIGVSAQCVVNWKKKNQPGDWEKYRELLQANMLQKFEEATLLSITNMRTRQQKRIDNMQIASMNAFVGKVKEAKVTGETAAETFAEMIRLETSLYVAPEQAIQTRGGSMTAAAAVKTGEGAVEVLVAMNQLFEETHGSAPSEPKTIKNSK